MDQGTPWQVSIEEEGDFDVEISYSINNVLRRLKRGTSNLIPNKTNAKQNERNFSKICIVMGNKRNSCGFSSMGRYQRP